LIVSVVTGFVDPAGCDSVKSSENGVVNDVFGVEPPGAGTRMRFPKFPTVNPPVTGLVVPLNDVPVKLIASPVPGMLYDADDEYIPAHAAAVLKHACVVPLTVVCAEAAVAEANSATANPATLLVNCMSLLPWWWCELTTRVRAA
jgi:hypothetical protein